MGPAGQQEQGLHQAERVLRLPHGRRLRGGRELLETAAQLPGGGDHRY